MSEDRETPAGAPAADPQTGATPSAPQPGAAAPGQQEAPAAHEAPNQSGTETAAGAPVEESEATTTEVLAAVDRAGVLSSEAAPQSVAAEQNAAADTAVPAPQTPAPAAGVLAEVAGATPVTAPAEERAPIVLPDEMPSAGPSSPPAPPETPAAYARPDDDKILVSADHPIAALYMQTPMPPDLRGNRGAGVMIALLSTLVFAVLYAGALALWVAPTTPPSAFVSTMLQFGLWPVVAASAAFFIGLALLVLIVGRAGWWAYVLGGFLVGVLVWAAAIVGVAYTASRLDETVRLAELLGGEFAAGFAPLDLLRYFGLTVPTIAAGLIAREVIVWFGAWIGARGRRITRSNSEAIAEYEAALAEAQTTQP